MKKKKTKYQLEKDRLIELIRPQTDVTWRELKCMSLRELKLLERGEWAITKRVNKNIWNNTWNIKE